MWTHIRITSNRMDEKESIGDYRRVYEFSIRTHDDVEKGIHFNLLEFERILYPKSFLKRIQNVESIFDYNEIDDEKRCRISVLKLKRFARFWYDNLIERREREGKSRIRSWEKLKKHLKKKFVSRKYEQENSIRMTTVRQESLGVEEYIREFEWLNLGSNVQDQEEQRCSGFIEGLNINLWEKVEVYPYELFEELAKLAIKF